MSSAVRLTAPMRTLLTDALVYRRNGLAVLGFGPPTVAALIRRGLAYEDTGPDGRKYAALTPQGVLVAARLLDRGQTLRPGDVVVYHGSREDERGWEYIVMCTDRDGRLVLLDSYNASRELARVRRDSVSATGETLLNEDPTALDDAAVAGAAPLLVEAYRASARRLGEVSRAIVQECRDGDAGPRVPGQALGSHHRRLIELVRELYAASLDHGRIRDAIQRAEPRNRGTARG
ncbi:hypothetical protein [Thermomonospora cellulosilytica]|uniref:Uncharacterized protein n=1 Tax=Thermomonospora cellulosilytica TaxID=1411118 RepID=A0A7W3N1L7_9ACTN|nr:hypothetical protein [Thermomonospora cellulosilytica]MBA9005874.1 hypothetical protein [Thermomonospora cellulosilytica]